MRGALVQRRQSRRTRTWVALAASGVGVPSPGSPIAQLRENVKLSTCYEDYGWVNTIQIWARGTVNLAEGVVNIEGFAA